MTETDTLPEVAQRVYTPCKKCGCERYHVVLAHKTATSAKVECEVCHSKKTYKLPSKKKKKATRRTKAPVNRWDEVKELVSQDNKVGYSMKGSFVVHNTIDHPKFGIGVVTAMTPQSIEVVFEDSTRSLVHNRS